MDRQEAVKSADRIAVIVCPYCGETRVDPQGEGRGYSVWKCYNCTMKFYYVDGVGNVKDRELGMKDWGEK